MTLVRDNSTDSLICGAPSLCFLSMWALFDRAESVSLSSSVVAPGAVPLSSSNGEEPQVATKGRLLYEGKAKKLYATENDQVLWVEYLDQATAFNGEKKDQISGKGILNNQISSRIFMALTELGIPNHLIEELSITEQLVKAVEIVPLEVVVRNIAAGSISKRLGIPEGTPFNFPVVEFYYKDDDLGDPLINLDHIRLLELATPEELAEIRRQALVVNTALQELFTSCGIDLVDFKLEFGRDGAGAILLADEISPDTCRLWDKETGEHLDKDVYRRDLGDLVSVYETVLERLEAVSE